MGYVNRTINNILQKTTLVIKKQRGRRWCRPKSYGKFFFSILVISKLNLHETVLMQKNGKHNSCENKLVYSNVSEWSDMSTGKLLFQWASTMKIQLGVLVKYKADLIIISLKINLFSPWYSWKIGELALNNNHSFTHFNHCQFCIFFLEAYMWTSECKKAVIFLN